MSNIRINGNTKSNIKISLDRTGILNLQNRAKESSFALNEYITRRKNNEWMSGDEIENYRSAFERYKSSTSALADLQRNFGNYNEEDGKERDEWISTLSTDFDSASDVFGKYKTADSYNAAVKAIEEEKRMETADLSAIEAEIKDIEAQIEARNKRKPVDYDSLMPSNPFDGEVKNKTPVFTPSDKPYKTLEELENELADKRAYYEDAKTIQETLATIQKETTMASDPKNMDGFNQYIANYNKTQEENANKSWLEIALWSAATANDNPVNQTINTVVQNKREDKSWQLPQGDWSDDEKRVLGGYFNEDPQKAIDYVVKKNNEKAKVEQGKTEKEIQDSATSGFLAGAGHTIGSIAAAPFALADYLDDLTDKAAGRPIIEESVVTPFEYSQAVTGGISTHLNEKSGTLNENIPVIGGKGLGDVYGLGHSILQSAASAYTLGGVGTFISYFGQGAAAGVDDALARGATDEQALAYGFVLGAAEGISENIGAEKLLKLSSPNEIRKILVNGFKKGGGKEFWSLVDKQGKAEAIEELFSGIVGQVADNWILQGKSNFEALAREYRALGMSATEAEKKAWIKSVGDVAYDALGGYLSGAVHAAPHTAWQAHNAAKIEGAKIVDSGGVATLQELANEMSGVVDTDTAANLSKLAGKVNGKKGVNAKAVGKLSYAVNDVRIQQNKADIVKALEEKGISKNNAAKYADILFEMNEEFFAGEESTFKLGTDEQWKKITGDENAYSVLRNIITDEKSPVNIRNLRYGLGRNGIRVDNEGNVNQEDVENYHTRQLTRAASEGLITPVKNEFDVSENGKTQITESGEAVKKRTFVDGEDGALRLRVNDNSTVDIEDVSFGTEDEAIVFSAIVSMGVDAETANAMLSLYNNTGKKAGARFAYGIDLAFNAGKINYSPEILRDIHSLTAQQADAVYKLGRQYAKKSAQKAQKRVDAKKKKAAPSNRGEVIYEGDLADENGELAIKESELKDVQRASLSGIRLLAEISNIRFHIYRSEKMISKDGKEEFRYVTPGGKTITANGFYITGTNDIYIDLNAGNNGDGTMMYTAAHEIMHFIKDFSPAKFQEIADFLMEEYAKRPNVNVRMLLERQKISIKQRADADMFSEQEIDDMAFEEMVCDAMSGMLIDGSFADSMAKLQETNKGLWQTIVDAVTKLLERWGVVVDAYKKMTMNSHEARLVAQMDGAFRKLQQMFAEGMVDAGNAYARMGKTDTSANFKNKVRYLLRENLSDRSNGEGTKNITIDMTEDARYEVLKGKKIRPQRIEVDESLNIDFEFLENNIKSLVEKPLIKKLRELGYLKKYNTSVIDVGFELTAGGVKKSLHSQTVDYGGSFGDFAKVVLNLQKLLDHSVLLDVHSDKAKGTVKENPRLKQVYVLISAFEEGNSITPVQFEIKRYVDEQNRLYLAVALTKIETGVMGDTILDKDQASTHLLPVSKTEAGVVGNTASPKRMRTYLLPASDISISDLFANVNPRDGKFLKYVPNQFLNDEQILAKNKALELEGIKYFKASKNGQTNISQRTDGKVMYQERSTALLEKEETRTDYAPVFYSKLERVVDDMKEQKLGADSVIGYLKGRGIKDEEIKHLGIRELLKGKKSVTKLELKKAIAENKPRIEEIVLTDNPNVSNRKRTKHGDASLLGGSNYREILFILPLDNAYTNHIMYDHWRGRYNKNVLAHTRIQDFTDVHGKRLLFVEEIQSDWHNMAKLLGDEKHPSNLRVQYLTKKEELNKRRRKVKAKLKKLTDSDPRKSELNKELEMINRELTDLRIKYMNILYRGMRLEKFPPSDLFGDTYHEYILKRLIRLAAEEGYDSLAWAPAKVHTARWDKEYEGAYTILYDQNIPGFLKRYGKQWGATVGTTTINAEIEDDNEEGYIEESLYEELTSGTIDVWRMDITDSMRDSALYEGQMMFQERSTEPATETSENKYSYEEIIRKPDMPITTVGGNVPTNRADVVALAKKNAAQVGKANKDGSVSVHVNDIDTDVILTTHGLRHGLRRKQQMTKANGIVTLMAGEIIQNSIRINELTPAANDVDSTYVLMGIAEDIDGYVYIVRSVVNKYDNELVSMDALYALNAKKELAVQRAPRLAGKPLSVTSSTISIADLLDYVNEYFPDILPEDVLQHYGHTERPSGDLGGSVLYQQRTSDPTQDKVIQQLRKENAQLAADLADVKELLALQGKVTGGKMFSKTSLQVVAKRLANKVNAKSDVSELVELLNDAYGYLLAEREANWDGFVEKTRPVTDWLMRNAQEKKPRTDEAQAALKYIRSKSVYLDEAQKQEAEYIFGSYNDFRKKAMGRITVTDSARVSLDSQWQEFAEMFPAYFDRDVNSADQPIALMEAIDALQNTYDYFGSDMMDERSLLMDVYDGYWDIATLRTVADKAQREVNQLKAKHRQQMAAIRDKHKQADVQLRREYIAKAKRLRENYRKQSEARIEKIAAQYQASRRLGIDNRRKTEMRHKIRRVVSELNKLLLHGSKEHNVKIGLKKATAEALLAVNMDTVNAEKRLAEIQRKIDATNDPNKIAELQETYERVERQGENMLRKLTALKNAYEEIKDSADPLIANAYHPEIEERIKMLRKEVGDTPLREMSIEQLENVYDTYRMVLHTIRSANKTFMADKSESIASLASQVMEEVHSIGGTKAYTIKSTTGIKKFYWNSLKPVYAFKTIGSDTLSALFDNIRAGEDLWATDVSQAKDYFKSVSDKYGYDSWDLNRQYSFKSKTGKEFSLSIEQIMSLYAYSKRKQADEHIEKGGFVFDGDIEITQKKLGVPVKYTVNTAAAHNLSRETLGQIINILSKDQCAFVDEMQAYLSDVMGAKGNEVSLAMFGVELFKEKAYFPLKSAKQFLYEQNEVAGEIRLKNSGFSKETVAHANNPIILSNFMDVWANHVNDMSMYHAFVLPLEDFNRVFNYKTPTTEDLDTESVKMYIQNAYGEQPIRYIRQLLTDLNGGARSDPSSDIITRMTSLFKKAAVFSSASVVVQQPSAIARAASMVDSKYFATKLSITQHQKEWAEVKKYAPVAIIKEMGYFDTHMGKSTTDFIKAKSYETLSEKAKGFFADSGYRDEMLSKAPALADELSWCYIWNAVKKEIADTTELAKGSEPFLKKCGERFTEVVVHTQVYDSVLSRSAMMRSKDTGMKMATAFMAEPTTSINMLADAIIQGKRGDKSAAAKTVGAVVASLILNAVLVSFVYAGRDDDEDETYAEKYAGALAGELVDSFNPLTMLPFVKDIVSLAQGYDVERSDMAIISDLFTAFDKLSNDKLPTYRKIEDFGGAIAAMFGLPVKNVMRDIRAMYNTVLMFLNGEETSTEDVVEAVKKEVIG